MARNQAYPVELVQNFADAVRHHNAGDHSSRPPMATDGMILRALLNHPLIDPVAQPASTEKAKPGAIEPAKALRASTH